MTLKSILPLSIKQLYRRVEWFINNYKGIDNIQLKSTHYHGPITYDSDGLTTSNNADFVNEPRFAKAYAASAATNPWPGFTLQWRVYIVCWLADHVKQLNGDFIECGVNTGAYARAVIEYTQFNSLNKVFYLFDTFEGFPEVQITEAEREKGIGLYGGGHYKDVYNQVVATFASFHVKIVKGRVPESLTECTSESIAYLSIDMNAVAPEIATAHFFWPKLVGGGVIILDDYGFPMHIHQKVAFDNFAAEKGVTILSLPTGQGIIFKP